MLGRNNHRLVRRAFGAPAISIHHGSSGQQDHTGWLTRHERASLAGSTWVPDVEDGPPPHRNSQKRTSAGVTFASFPLETWFGCTARHSLIVGLGRGMVG